MLDCAAIFEVGSSYTLRRIKMFNINGKLIKERLRKKLDVFMFLVVFLPHGEVKLLTLIRKSNMCGFSG